MCNLWRRNPLSQRRESEKRKKSPYLLRQKMEREKMNEEANRIWIKTKEQFVMTGDPFKDAERFRKQFWKNMKEVEEK